MNDILKLEERQVRAEATPLVALSPWVVQGIVYELITGFFIRNTPQALGYPLSCVYDHDKLKSGIYVDIAYNYNAAAANKRPSIFISRGDCEIVGKTMGHKVPGGNIAESEVAKLLLNTVPINVAVIASPIMMVELLADYTKQAFVSYDQEIQKDFNFRRFRLRGVTKPQIYVEAKEYFVVNLSIEVVYDEGWILRRDDLKLKTVGMAIFDALDAQLRLA